MGSGRGGTASKRARKPTRGDRRAAPNGSEGAGGSRRREGPNGPPPSAPRRGWRETIEPGLYRNHRVGCEATLTREPGVRCDCPFQAHLPTRVPGRSYPRNLQATTLRDARAEKERRQRQARQARRGGRVTLGEFFSEIFLEKQQLRPATRRNYERIFRTYYEPIIGDVRLGDLNEEHIADLIAHLGRCARERRETTRKRNANWVAQQLIPLQSALSAAVRWRRIPENPLRNPKLPDCPPKREGETDTREDPKAILSKSQLERLYEAAREAGAGPLPGERDACLFQTTYEFGLRNSEARGLRWTDVHFDESRITVARQIDPVTAEEAQTKGKRTRQPPGGDAAFECLDAWRWLSVERSGADPRGYIWHGADPRAPMPIGLPNRRIQIAQRRAQLTRPDGKPLIVFHGLRHSRASHLLLDGVPMLEVSRFLGHANQLITASTYSHLVPEEEFAAIREILAASRSSKPSRRGPS